MMPERSSLEIVIRYVIGIAAFMLIYVLLTWISGGQHEITHQQIFKYGCEHSDAEVQDNFFNWSTGRSREMARTIPENVSGCQDWVYLAHSQNEIIGYNVLQPLNMIAACLMALLFIRIAKVAEG
jgi:hypothetical protein